MSKGSEGFTKCQTHQNKDGIVVPDTPYRKDEVIMVDYDLGPLPGIYLGAPDEESEAIREVPAAKIGLSAPATLVAPVKQATEGAGGGGPSAPVIPPAQGNQKERVVRGGPSVPVIPATTTAEPGTMTVGGALNVPRTPSG